MLAHNTLHTLVSECTCENCQLSLNGSEKQIGILLLISLVIYSP